MGSIAEETWEFSGPTCHSHTWVSFDEVWGFFSHKNRDFWQEKPRNSVGLLDVTAHRSLLIEYWAVLMFIFHAEIGFFWGKDVKI